MSKFGVTLVKRQSRRISPERGRLIRGRDVSSRGPNLPQYSPFSLSLQEEDFKSGHIFYGKGLSCFLQEMWKATRDPCGTVLYVHIKSPHIKPSSNAIIPPLTGFTSNVHTSKSNPTHPHSYVTHIKSLPQKLLPT